MFVVFVFLCVCCLSFVLFCVHVCARCVCSVCVLFVSVRLFLLRVACLFTFVYMLWLLLRDVVCVLVCVYDCNLQRVRVSDFAFLSV